MSLFEDLKDQTKNRILILSDRLQESSLYVELKDRYENLNSRMQLLVRVSLSILILFGLFSFIRSPLNLADENIASYQEKRELLRSLYKTSRASQEVPVLPVAPAIESIRLQVDSYVRQIGLIDSQIIGLFQDASQGQLIPTAMSEGGLKVQLSKLNIRQITDISHKLSNLNPSVKLVDLALNSNQEDSRYYDANWRLVALKIPVLTPAITTEADDKKPNKARGSGR